MAGGRPRLRLVRLATILLARTAPTSICSSATRPSTRLVVQFRTAPIFVRFGSWIERLLRSTGIGQPEVCKLVDAPDNVLWEAHDVAWCRVSRGLRARV